MWSNKSIIMYLEWARDKMKNWLRKINQIGRTAKSVRREERKKRIKRGIRDKRGRERSIAPEGGLKN